MYCVIGSWCVAYIFGCLNAMYFSKANSSCSSAACCVHTMYSLLYSQSRGTSKPSPVILPGVLPSTVYSAVVYLSMMREERGRTAVYFYLSVVWLLLGLTHSLSNLVMSCKVTCLPPRLSGWSESGIPGISLPGSLLGWMVDTVYTPQPCHTLPPSAPPRTHGETKAPALKCTLALSRTPSLPLGKLRCQE